MKKLLHRRSLHPLQYWLLLFLLGIVGGWVSPVSAQNEAPYQVVKDTVSLNFPQEVIFSLELSGAEQVKKIALVYGTSAHTCLEEATRQEIEFKAGLEQANIQTRWIWDLSGVGALPQGAELWWQWVITSTGLQESKTDVQRQILEDPRFSWHQLDEDGIIVAWVKGSDAFGKSILNTAKNSLEKLSREVGIPKPKRVQLNIYPSAEDVRSALINAPEWVGGKAFPEFGIILFGAVPRDSAWVAAVVPHELAHLVVNERIFNCVGSDLPTWLSEGLSGYSEGSAGQVDQDKVMAALRSGVLPALTTLQNGFSLDSDRARLSYAQTRMVVTYMIRKFGPTKMDALLGNIQRGIQIDAALLAVYGLDTDGIDQAWRASLGYGKAPTPQTPTPFTVLPTIEVTRTAVPTLEVMVVPTALPSLTPTLTVTPIPSATLLAPSMTSTTVKPTKTVPISSPTNTLPFGIADLPVRTTWILLGSAAFLLFAALLVGVIIVGTVFLKIYFRRNKSRT